MNIELIKGLLGIVSPEFITNFSLNKKIENLVNHISYLKANNLNTEPFINKLEDIIYQRDFGMAAEKYRFFYSHRDIQFYFQHIHLKTLAPFTIRNKDNKFVVSMNWADKLISLIFCFIGLIALIIFFVTLNKLESFNNLNISDLIKLRFDIILIIALLIFSSISAIHIFVYFFAPFFLIPKFNRVFKKEKINRNISIL